MSHRIGEQYQAIVSGVVAFGLFVRVPELGIDGLVHVANLPHDYYHFDPSAHALSGEHYGRRFRLMDRIAVRLAAVDVADRKIDFHLAAEQLTETAPARNRRRARRRAR